MIEMNKASTVPTGISAPNFHTKLFTIQGLSESFQLSLTHEIWFMLFLLHKWIYPQLLILIKTSISQLLEVGLSSQIKRFIENIHKMFVFLHRKCWLCKVG